MDVAAPAVTYRLIPSQFPPIGLFETVASADDLEAVMELSGWTNDRLVTERIARLPKADLVFGRPNASIVMAAFLHAPPMGARFSGPDLGAWYAAARIETGIAEVGHHLRREAFARGKAEGQRTFRVYQARIEGAYRDVRPEDRPDCFTDDYGPSQAFGEGLRAAARDGLVYPSLRHRDGLCLCAFRPRKILDVVQAEHFSITVRTDMRQVVVDRLPAG
ncbi:RES family NAD+ phosphorylase [Devosia sp. BK]|uniref:RES family NAD+ phosphorylase n=1 Tax=Devosia sp. BK TaxID=2871706 RepID=UPI00293A52E5|nr:RES family NAD+ phosphorylase [Devosia sp. BK]MDV3252150.1 RES family NAD+ phosphorylase [Devosia sp. BK]